MGTQPSLSVPSRPPDEDRLDSWKEIAAYMKRDVRTVRRWEKSEGLPVRRHLHNQRASVSASRAELDKWWSNGRSNIEQHEQDFRAATEKRRWLVWATPAIVAAALAAAVIWWFMANRPALSFTSRQWILLADFQNDTGDPRFDRGLSEALAISLSQSKYANVFSRERVAESLKRMGKPGQRTIGPDVGREICLRENVRALVVCGITRTGQQYELSARLVDPQSGDTVASYSARARREDDILDSLDSIATGIRQGLGESLHSIRQTRRPLPQVTTSSLEALTRYADARDQWLQGHFDQSQDSYESALKADPNFAMAHAALGSTLVGTIFHEPIRAQQHFEKALSLSDRISDRERAYIRALYQDSLGHRSEAEDEYVNYLQSYPDDTSARYSLARIRMFSGRYEAAISDFQEVLRIDSWSTNAHVELATCYNFLSRWPEAISHYQQAYVQRPDLFNSSNLNHEYGQALIAAGNPAKARELYSSILANPDSRHRGLRSLALLDLYEGKYADALARLEDAVKSELGPSSITSRMRDHIFLAITNEGKGIETGSFANLMPPSQIFNSSLATTQFLRPGSARLMLKRAPRTKRKKFSQIRGPALICRRTKFSPACSISKAKSNYRAGVPIKPSNCSDSR
jgi:tetratricopeptide (TPR) repeat protein